MHVPLSLQPTVQNSHVGVILRYAYGDDAGRTLLEEVARLACDSCEDEGVGGDHYLERDDVHEQQ